MIHFVTKQRAIAAIAGFSLFTAIAYFVMTREALVFDTVVREYIYALRSNELTVFFKAITFMGNPLTLTVICCFILMIPKVRLSFGVPLSASALLAVIIQRVLKYEFHRARPALSLHLIEQGGYSFPSGHSFSILIFYGMLIFLCHKHIKSREAASIITILLSCLIFTIGLSRIYLGVHFPTDVLGGWALGVFILMLLISTSIFLERKNPPSI